MSLTDAFRNVFHRRKTDYVFILRGGASEIYTSIYNLFLLEQQVGHPLQDLRPFLIGDSAGAFVVSGMAAPSLFDSSKPALTASDLPEMFRDNIRDYLSHKRNDAKEKLEETIGSARLRDALLPICISSCQIFPDLQHSYFRYIPEGHFGGNQFLLPNLNEDVLLSDAVLASSSYPIKFGDHTIPDTGNRHIDMAFLETHTANMIELSNFYRTHRRGRNLVCVIMGNNYEKITIGETERFSLRSITRHFPEALRALVHMDMVRSLTQLLGEENVFDLSLWLDQPFAKGKTSPFPDPFKGYPHPIQRRMEITEQLINNNPAHLAKIDRLAKLMRPERSPPSPIPAFSQPVLLEASVP